MFNYILSCAYDMRYTIRYISITIQCYVSRFDIFGIVLKYDLQIFMLLATECFTFQDNEKLKIISVFLSRLF